MKMHKRLVLALGYRNHRLNAESSVFGKECKLDNSSSSVFLQSVRVID